MPHSDTDWIYDLVFEVAGIGYARATDEEAEQRELRSVLHVVEIGLTCVEHKRPDKIGTASPLLKGLASACDEYSRPLRRLEARGIGFPELAGGPPTELRKPLGLPPQPLPRGTERSYVVSTLRALAGGVASRVNARSGDRDEIAAFLKVVYKGVLYARSGQGEVARQFLHRQIAQLADGKAELEEELRRCWMEHEK
jgi:hypothetical protein